MNQAKWLTELQNASDGLAYGDLDVKITRHRNKTVKVAYRKDAKIQPKDNPEAFSDLEKLINSLITTAFDGKLAFGIEFKSGTIKEIVIKNKEVKTYGQNR